MRVWLNWQTHQIWVALLQWSFTPATVRQVKIDGKFNMHLWRNWHTR